MNNKLKDVLVKCSIVVTGCLLIFSALVFPIICTYLGFNFEDTEKLWIICWIITLLSGFIMVLLMLFWGFSKKTLTAEKIPCPFNNYQSFSELLYSKLEEKAYCRQNSLFISNDVEVTVYVRPSQLWTLDCFAIIRTYELTNEILEKINERITEVLFKYYKRKTITDTVNMVSIFCVDHITPVFRGLLDNNIQQNLKTGRLIVGISFGGKNIYIAKQKDGFAIARYKRLRRDFVNIIKEQKT